MSRWDAAVRSPRRRRRRGVEGRVASLLETDLSFIGVPGDYATHGLHPFAARFPPQIPALFIEALTREGDTILDPLVGSGTVLVEAQLRGRRGLGFDLDPLAVLIAGAKSAPLEPGRLEEAYDRIRDAASRSRAGGAGSGDGTTRDFREYWFPPEATAQLARLVRGIAREEDPAIRRFFHLIFSSTIVAKSGGVSLARDLAHSRPHRDLEKKPRSPFEEFERRFRKALPAMDSLLPSAGRTHTGRSDARRLPLRASSADLIVSSPPYASAVDYLRAHKFTLNWLGYPLDGLSELRQRYLGAEAIREAPPAPEGAARQVVEKLEEADARRARHIARYFHDLEAVLRETLRVLRPGRAAIWVVGPSRVRGVDVDTPAVMGDLAERVGFRLVGSAERNIDRDKRLLPQTRGALGDGIEARVLKEAVIGLVKPPAA